MSNAGANEQPNVAGQNGAQDTPERKEGKALNIGKKAGSQNYKPSENALFIYWVEKLKMTTSEGEKDKNWSIVAENVADALGTSARTPSAAAEHVKDMVKVIRSLASLHSQVNGENGFQCPEVRDENFDVNFENYVDGLWDWIQNIASNSTLTKADYKQTWWDKSTFVATRKFVLNLDLAQSTVSSKEKVAATKSKMEEENEEKKRLAEDRKRKSDAEFQETSEMRRRLSEGIQSISNSASEISQHIAGLLTPVHGNFIAPPPTVDNVFMEEIENTKNSVIALQDKVTGIETTMNSMSGNIEKLLAMMAANTSNNKRK